MKKLLLGTLSILSILGTSTAAAQNTIDLIGTTYSLDTIFHAKVGPGTTQTHLELISPAGSRLQVFYLTVDKTTPGVSMRAVCSQDKVAGLERPSAMAKRKSDSNQLYFAGTNGDFYYTGGYATNGSVQSGTPTSACVADRETYKTANSNYQFSVDVDGVARVSRLYNYNGTATLGDDVASFLGVNVASSPNNGITLYTSKYWGSSNETARAGSCAEVTAELVEGDSFYAGGTFRLKVTSEPNSTGDTTIPDGGFVIHGRGTSAKYKANTAALTFVNNLKVGDIVEFDNVVYIDESTPTRIYPAQVVSGNPKNVGGGETLDSESERGDASSLHPRTGIGVSQTGDSIIMMVVDGRSTISAGVRTSQLADIMRHAGAYEAVNLDGGGSSCLYTSALGVRNVGSDGNERAVGNGIFATITAPEDNVITEIRFEDWRKDLPKYSTYTPVFYGYNQYGVVVDTNLKGVTLSAPQELGEIIEDGATLFANGAGCHLLTANYNGLTASLVVTVDDNCVPVFRHPKVLLDSYVDYEADVYGVVGDYEIALKNSVFNWNSDNEGIATVDENGVVHGVQNGVANITGVLGDFSDQIEATVEIPTKHYQGIDENLDPSTWTLSGSNVENYSIAALGTEGMTINYTVLSSRKVEMLVSKNVASWARPDSLCIDINPGSAKIKNMTFYVTTNTGEELSYIHSNSLTADVVNRILVPVDTFIDQSDMSAYPITFTQIRIVPQDAANTEVSLSLPRVSWVYNVIPNDESGVESVVADNSNALLLTPNPVKSGTAVKLNLGTAVKYSVNSLNGAVVLKGEGLEIPTDGLATGVYIVSVQTDSGQSSARLVVL